MISKPRILIAIGLAAGLGACGLRGDLERPGPVFSDPPSEEAMLPVDVAAPYTVAEIGDGTYFNPLGGEIPIPAPDADVEDEGMGEIGPG